MDLGRGWADHMQVVSKKDLRGSGSRSRDFRHGWWLVLLVGISGLLFQSFKLQVVEGAELKSVSDQQRIRQVSLPAARGIMYDRTGKPLVVNVPVYRKVSWDIKKGLVLETITREQMLDSKATDGKQLILEAVARDYMYDSVMAHVLGYVGEIDETALNQANEQTDECAKSKVLGSIVGKGGIEKAYDCILRGQDGGYLLEVDTGGSMIRQIGKQEPAAGNPIHLTIDLELQQVAVNAMQDKRGAVIISNPTTGDILAMASAPTFDPNLFGILEMNRKPEERNQRISQLLQDESRPLLNRAVSAVYPPGSIFKIVTSVAGLEGGYIQADDTYVDTGVVELGEYQFRNWYLTQHGGTEGEINLIRALARSTDTFFYNLSGLMGPEEMARWAKGFGLGENSRLVLPGELDGLVPDPEWKLAAKNERWYLGNTYHMSIGQGDVLVTPLQAHAIAGVIANNGNRCLPRLVMGQDEPECIDLEISDDTVHAVAEGLVAACSPGGTGVPFFTSPWKVACKTGTAEFGPRKEDGNRDTHAWFTVYGPLLEDEEQGWILDDTYEPVLLTVVIEEGGGGSSEAAPVAKEIMDYWFERKQYKPIELGTGQHNQVQDEDYAEQPSDNSDEEGPVGN